MPNLGNDCFVAQDNRSQSRRFYLHYPSLSFEVFKAWCFSATSTPRVSADAWTTSRRRCSGVHSSCRTGQVWLQHLSQNYALFFLSFICLQHWSHTILRFRPLFTCRLFSLPDLASLRPLPAGQSGAALVLEFCALMVYPVR